MVKVGQAEKEALYLWLVVAAAVRVAPCRSDLLMAVLPAPVVPCLYALVHLRPDPVALWRWAVARRLAVRPALCL